MQLAAELGAAEAQPLGPSPHTRGVCLVAVKPLSPPPAHAGATHGPSAPRHVLGEQLAPEAPGAGAGPCGGGREGHSSRGGTTCVCGGSSEPRAPSARQRSWRHRLNMKGVSPGGAGPMLAETPQRSGSRAARGAEPTGALGSLPENRLRDLECNCTGDSAGQGLPPGYPSPPPPQGTRTSGPSPRPAAGSRAQQRPGLRPPSPCVGA